MKWFFLLVGWLALTFAGILVVVLVHDGVGTVLHEIQIVLLVFLSMFCFGLSSLLNLLGVGRKLDREKLVAEVLARKMIGKLK